MTIYINGIKADKFDLKRMHEDERQGRIIYIRTELNGCVWYHTA